MSESSEKFQEPEVVDPRTLEIGDQVGCVDTGTTLRLLTCDPYDSYDPLWLSLCNQPSATTHIWDQLVPAGNTALDLAGFGWKRVALPQVWARRKIQ